MAAFRFIASGRTALCALGLVAACAADTGDAAKELNQVTGGADGGVLEKIDASMAASDSGGGGFDSGGGGGEPDAAGGGGGLDSGGGGVLDTGSPDSILTTNMDSGFGGGMDTGVADVLTPSDTSLPDAPDDTGPPPPVDAGPDCLKNIPSTCPNCMTQNAGDMASCQKFITCYLTNSCNPSDACGQMDGICGVNKVGVGSSPQTAALATYACACP